MNGYQLQLLKSYEQRNKVIENHIREIARDRNELQILEAGCGQRWIIDLKGVSYRLTGLDIDTAALEIRREKFRDLDEIIEGDLRNVDLGERKFDVIYNAYVLEHVDGAKDVLNNFLRWLKPGGIVVLYIPDPASVKGFVTKFTPTWFHVMYYRYFLGSKTAGLPGHMPYPTYFDSIVSRRGIHEFCAANQLSVIAEYGDGLTTHGTGLRRLFLKLLVKGIAALSLGSLSSRHVDLLFVIRRSTA